MNSSERFRELFEQYYSPLCNYALKVVRDKAEAEDIVQNLFTQLWEKGTLLQADDPERYLLRCIRFKTIDYLRHRDARLHVPLESWHEAHDSSSDISEEEIEPLLHYFAARLPPKTREVFLLSRQSQLSYKEIAERMQISVKTVEAQMARALREMRAMLKAQQFFSVLLFL